MSVVSVPGMLRQEDHKVKASLRYIVRPKTSQTKPNQPIKKKEKKTVHPMRTNFQFLYFSQPRKP